MRPQLEAERQLLAIEAASVPHMKPDSAQGVLRRWSRQLRAEQQEPPTREEMLAQLRASGIPITFTERQKKPRKRTGRDGTRGKGQVNPE